MYIGHSAHRRFAKHIGVIGASGEVARTHHLPAIAELGAHGHLASVYCRRTSDIMKTLGAVIGRVHPHAAITHSLAEFIGASDVVLIASPDDTHMDYLRAATSMGKDVLVEKPLCLRDDQLEEARNIPVSTRIGVGFQHRYFVDLIERLRIAFSEGDSVSEIAWTSRGKQADWRSMQPRSERSAVASRLPHIIDLLQCVTKCHVAKIDVRSVYRADRDILKGSGIDLEIVLRRTRLAMPWVNKHIVRIHVADQSPKRTNSWVMDTKRGKHTFESPFGVNAPCYYSYKGKGNGFERFPLDAVSNGVRLNPYLAQWKEFLGEFEPTRLASLEDGIRNAEVLIHILDLLPPD